MYLVIFSAVIFGVVVITVVIPDSGNTTTQYTEGQTVYDKDWVETRWGSPSWTHKYFSGIEAWKYSAGSGGYTIFYFKDGILVDYVQKKRTNH
jgi:hypothetical protein